MRFYGFLLAICFCLFSVAAEDYVNKPSQADSILTKVDSMKRVRSDRFYDALFRRFNKGKLPALVIRSIVSPGRVPKGADIKEYRLVKERKYFEDFRGLTIRDISVFPSNVFSEMDSLPRMQRILRQWHRQSREHTIRRYLLFIKGGSIDPDLMVRNEQLLRSLSYLSDAYIVLQKTGEQEVDIFVYTRDNLSLSPAFTSQGIKRTYFSLGESNLWGTGNKLELGTFLSAKSPLFRGYKGDFTVYNLFGSFFDFDLLAYKDFVSSSYKASVEKNFILPQDYAGGLSYEKKRYNDFQKFPDSTVIIGENIIDVWAGRSMKISPFLGSFFMSTRWSDTRFPVRYDVNQLYNPRYHNRRNLFVSTGFYKENFYRGNLIYGFGRSEDIAYGYRFELLGGYSWGEFAKRSYFAGKWQFGLKTNYGFLTEKMEMGSYFNYDNQRYEQSVFLSETKYFTHLIPVGHWAIRNFLSARYVQGFNRLVGEGEKLYFSSQNSPRAIRYKENDNEKSGYNRLIASLESVAFSPYYVHNFRFAFYGFWDSAWLGFERKILKNDYYSTVGFGVRIKNERLIFQTLQLRFGIALWKPAGTLVNWINLSEETKVEAPRLIPERPAEIDYR